MIRHIVTWKFATSDAAEQDAAFAAVKNALEPLVGVVPDLLDLAVSRSVGASAETDADFGLVSHHPTIEDVRAYAVHPAHVAAAAIVGSHTRERRAFDYEV